MATQQTTPRQLEAQEDWILATMENSWEAYNSDYGAARYMKDSMGFVHIDGMPKSGTSASATMFTLPVGYRPGYHQLLAIQSASVLARLDITVDGVVSMVGSGSTTWAALHGITFKAEA